jgi:hypothetical protein
VIICDDLLSIRISKEMAADITDTAKDLNITMSDFVRRACCHLIGHLYGSSPDDKRVRSSFGLKY